MNYLLESSPYFLIDTVHNHLKIAGESCHRDVNKFFEPINNWLTDFLQNDLGKLTVNFEIKSFGLPTAKILFDMTERMSNNAAKGQEIIVSFNVFGNNSVSYKLARDLQQEFANLKFNIIKR